MKKLLVAAIVMLAMCACGGDREYIDVRGLSMGMKASAMADSMQARGLSLDTLHSGENSIVLVDTLANTYTFTIYHNNDTISDVMEIYTASYNDSTSNLWQTRHDELEKEFGWPNMPKRGDLHKIAFFRNDKGSVQLELINTNWPTLNIHYSIETTE